MFCYDYVVYFGTEGVATPEAWAQAVKGEAVTCPEDCKAEVVAGLRENPFTVFSVEEQGEEGQVEVTEFVALVVAQTEGTIDKIVLFKASSVRTNHGFMTEAHAEQAYDYLG